MAKLTRKLWVGIGAASLVGASVTGSATAQDPAHKGHGQSPPAQKDTANPGDGGEAYLKDGGPRDTRIRFYRDIALIRGHLRVGGELIELEQWDAAFSHFVHPSEELYKLLEKYIKLHGMQPFERELQALAQTVKAKRKGAYEQASKVVDRRLTAALGAAKRFMTPVRSFAVKSAVEVLKVAVTEYEASIEDGKFIKPVEYEDSRGFVLEAERMIEGVAGELAKIDADALAKVRGALAKLKAAWPSPIAPPAPVMEVADMSALVADIELHASRF